MSTLLEMKFSDFYGADSLASYLKSEIKKIEDLDITRFEELRYRREIISFQGVNMALLERINMEILAEPPILDSGIEKFAEEFFAKSKFKKVNGIVFDVHNVGYNTSSCIRFDNEGREQGLLFVRNIRDGDPLHHMLKNDGKLRADMLVSVAGYIL